MEKEQKENQDKGTPEQDQFSRELQQMSQKLEQSPTVEGIDEVDVNKGYADEAQKAREELGLSSEHDEGGYEHSHEETQESKGKMADEILKRAEGASDLVGQRARDFAERVRQFGEGEIMRLKMDFDALAEGKHDDFLDDIRKSYPEWKKKDFAQLYLVLFGETVDGESWEKIQEVKNRLKAGVEQYKEVSDEIAKLRELSGFQSFSYGELEEHARANIRYRKERAERPVTPAEPIKKNWFRRLFG